MYKDWTQPSNVRSLWLAGPEISDARPTERTPYRTFTKEHKARILQEADQCKRGELAALLRRESIDATTLARWRKQRDKVIQQWTEPQQSVRQPEERTALEERVAQLEKENARLQQRLQQVETVIDMQRKISALLTIPLNSLESANDD